MERSNSRRSEAIHIVAKNAGAGTRHPSFLPPTNLLSEMFPNRGDRNADGFHRGGELILVAAEFTAPILNFPRFVNVHFAAILRTLFFQVV